MADPSIYTSILSMVHESRCDPGREYIQRIMSTAGNMREHILNPSRQVKRWFGRMRVPAGEFDTWIQQSAQASGVSNLEVCLALRLFTEEIPGIKNDPICADEPQCGNCTISAKCPHYTGAGKPITDSEAIVRALSSGSEVAVEYDSLLSFVLFGSAPDERQNNALKSMTDGINGDIGNLFALTTREMTQRHGFTEAESLTFQGIRKLFDCWRDASHDYSVQFKTGKDFFDLYHLRLRDQKKEQFWVVLLNQQNQFIGEEMVSVGTLTEAPIHPREVFAPAIRGSAAAVAFVHNHPGGDPAPSPMDIDITNRLIEAGKILGIRILDHVVIAPGKYYSFAEYGKIQT